MNEIKWYKSGVTGNYLSTVGCFELVCRPKVEYTGRNEWQCDIYIGNTPLVGGPSFKSLELSQEDAEIRIIQYLFGCGLVTLKTLKKIGLLEEMLSEVGIDL